MTHGWHKWWGTGARMGPALVKTNFDQIGTSPAELGAVASRTLGKQEGVVVGWGWQQQATASWFPDCSSRHVKLHCPFALGGIDSWHQGALTEASVSSQSSFLCRFQLSGCGDVRPFSELSKPVERRRRRHGEPDLSATPTTRKSFVLQKKDKKNKL